MELGNMVFGHSRGQEEFNDSYSSRFFELFETACGDTHSPSFENDVFVLRPYYCGDCDCGFEEKDWEWSLRNKHLETCYTNDFHKLEEYCKKRWKSTFDAPKAYYNKCLVNLYKKHKLDYDTSNPIVGCGARCSCGVDKQYQEWRKTNDHLGSCSLYLPNFHHKETGFIINWYKYPFRDSYTNMEMTEELVNKVILSCYKSLGENVVCPCCKQKFNKEGVKG